MRGVANIVFPQRGGNQMLRIITNCIVAGGLGAFMAVCMTGGF